MISLIRNTLIGLATISIFFAGCGKKTLFDELGTSRLRVVFKGTYESNNPGPWISVFPGSDSVMSDYNEIKDSDPTACFLDVAELRITTGPHKQKFANHRMTYSFGLNDTEAFFNGTGVSYPNEDVRPDFNWEGVDVYFRKILFDGAKRYELVGDPNFAGIGRWDQGIPVWEYFHEQKIEGIYDINRFLNLSYYDTLKKDASNIRHTYPVTVPIFDGLRLNTVDPETVLEVRFIIKNFIKRYEYIFADSVTNIKYNIHCYGPSDWLRNTDTQDNYIGGNLLAVARSYVPGKTVTITGTAPPNKYIIAFSDSATVHDFSINVSERARPLVSDYLDVPKNVDRPAPNDIEAILDYALKSEFRKVEYNHFVDKVNLGLYNINWPLYEQRVNLYRIPPLATRSTTTGFILENVPVGKTYSICYNTDAPLAGELPGAFSTPVVRTITAEEANQTITVNLP